MNLTITVNCCGGQQKVRMEDLKKKKGEIEELLDKNPLFACAICGKRRKIESYEFEL